MRGHYIGRLRACLTFPPSRALTLALLLVLTSAWSASWAAESRALFQISTIEALLAGVFEGHATCGELKKHGDFGLGTFEALDGEMILVDGIVYRADSQGRTAPVADSLTSPFAAVTFFNPKHVIGPLDAASLNELTSSLDATLPSLNYFYALRLDGTFAKVLARSVPRQTSPYPTLSEAAKAQTVFELRNVSGTIVGFRCPFSARGINVPGYHLHFINADRTVGGHVLDLSFAGLTARLDVKREFVLRLPADDDPAADEAGFGGANLGADRSEELHRVEQGRN